MFLRRPRTAAKDSSRSTLSLSSLADLEAAKAFLENDNGHQGNLKSLAVVFSDPRVIGEHGATVVSLLSSTLPLLQLDEIRLAIRGVGKQLGHQPVVNQAMLVNDSDSVAADAVADLLLAVSQSQSQSPNVSITLDLSVSKLTGSLKRLCDAVLQATCLTQVILHECDNDQDEHHAGILPLLDALSQSPKLETLMLEAVQIPMEDNNEDNTMAANILVRLASSSGLTRLDLSNCIHLGDDELVPLFQQLPQSRLQRLKLSTGLSLHHDAADPRQWGARSMSALALALEDPSCPLNMLTITHSADVTPVHENNNLLLLPIVQAMKKNTELTRLHLYQSSNNTNANATANTKSTSSTTLAGEMISILSSNQNMTLLHCNSLGATGRDEFQSLCFYTRLNQLNRRALIQGCDNNTSAWIQTLMEQVNDHRIVHYLLSTNPSLIPTV